MKRFLFLVSLILFSLVFCTTSATAAPLVRLNGQPLSFDVPPVVENGRILLPLRGVFEAMGAQVNWDSSTMTATAVKGNTTVVVKIGSLSPTINGIAKHIDVPAKTIKGRTFAPLRFVCEAFGGTVEWNSVTETATITNQSNYYADGVMGNLSGWDKVIYADGQVYEGEYKNGMKNGHGTNIWPNGSKYVGEFRDNLRHGQGTQYVSNGDIYIGAWQYDQRTGQGTYIWQNGNKYVGTFVRGEKSGYGTFTWSDGATYVGQWENDNPNGKGAFTWPDGAIYTGGFKDGLKNGQGTFTWPDGSKYVGTWFIDKPHGNGIFYSTNGTSIALNFNNGVLTTSTNTPIYIPVYVPTTTSEVIESRIDGTFEGWDGDTIFKLTNGQIWQQSSYAYHYHYAYRPEVIIYKSGSTYKMHVEGVDRDISVIRLK